MRALLLLPAFLVACSASAEPGVSPADAGSDTSRADTEVPKDSAVTDTARPSDTAVEEDTAMPPADSGGAFCGGIGGIACATGSYCFMEVGKCTTSDAGGTCKSIPMGCTKELNPVCGCDGKTYSNPCMAAAAGVNVAKTGSCASESALCGSVNCSLTEYCDYAGEGACSGEGTCKPRPEACTGLYDPVCGCDGKTHSNACVGRSNGTDSASKGACP